MPIKEFIVFSAGFTPDLKHNYSYFEEHPNDPKLVEAKSYLDTLGVDKINKINLQSLNEITYAMYGIVAYGFFSGECATADKTITGREEYRYIGTDLQGKLITNDYFPNDANSSTLLLDKDWIPNASTNWPTWAKAPNSPEFRRDYIYETQGLLNDGDSISYSLKEILAKKPTHDGYSLKEDYINLQSSPKFSVRGSARLQHRTNDGKIWYDTFTLPALLGDNALNVDISTPNNNYTIYPTEDYIDIPVTVTSTINSVDHYLLTFIASQWVKFENNQKEGESYTYNKRIYKTSLEEGTNRVTLTGYGGIKSSFVGDQEKIESDNTDIWVTVAEDNLIAQLDLPATAGIGREYTVKDASYIPAGARILSSTLEKKTTGSFSEITDWNESSYQDSHPVKATITYKLTIVLDNGQVDSDTKSIEIIDGRAVDATAELDLTPYTYEGHPAYAHDVSVFDVEGTTYYAKQAYEAGLADNHFEVVESTPHTRNRLDDTTSKFTFQNEGYYNIKLEVKTQDGKELYDTKPIEVRKTPYIEDHLGGSQKQNRRQVLNLSVAINPNHPVTDFFVEVEDMNTGEKVHLTSAKQNSTAIKTRDITEDATEYFHNYTLEFLTKNTTERVYKYTAYVRDSKGDTDTISELFTVYPDLPPIAQIDMVDSFIRDENSDVATVLTEDGTISSDGDQVERTWRIRRDANNNGSFEGTEPLEYMTGYNFQDLSFGSKQKVSFEKEGVGKVKVRLDVKEVWIEPTLEEYVTDADRLTGAVIKDVIVHNISPMVSVEPIDTFKEDVLILTTEKDIEEVKNQKATIEQYLRNNGIDSVVETANYDNEDLLPQRQLYTVSQEIGKENDFNSYLFEIDNSNMYRVLSSGFSIEGTSTQWRVCEPPFIIEARDMAKNQVVWTYSTMEENFKLKQDNSEKYLYVRCEDEKTIVLDKKTGSEVVTLNFELGDCTIYYENNTLYFFYDGAIKKLMSDNTLKTLHSIGSKASSKVDGKIHFGYTLNSVTYRGIFDLTDESVKSQYITKNGEKTNHLTLKPREFDIYGTMLIGSSYEDEHEDKYYTFQIYNEKNELINQIEFQDSDHFRYEQNGFITDESKRATYFYRCYQYHYTSSSYYYMKIGLYEVNGDRVENYTDRGTNGYWQNIIFKKHLKSENALYFVGGADYALGYLDPATRAWKVSLPNYDFGQTLYHGVFCDAVGEEARQSDAYSIIVTHDEQRMDGEQLIRVSKHAVPLEDTVLRNLLYNSNFRDDSQKNVVMIDDVNVSNTSTMTNLIDTLKNMRVKFTAIGKNLTSNNFLVKIKDALQGNTIEYNTFSVENNLLNSGNVINTNKEDIKIPVIKTSGTGSSQTKLSKNIKLEEGETYEYEYDIKFTQKGSLNNADIFNLSNTIINHPNEGTSNIVMEGIGNTQIDDFDSFKRNEFFTYDEGSWGVHGDVLKSKWDANWSGYQKRTYTKNITFTTDTTSILSFNYYYNNDINGDDDKSEFIINVDGVDSLVRRWDPFYSGEENRNCDGENEKEQYFSKTLPAGDHTLKLKYAQVYDNNTNIAYIDNLSVKPVVRRTNGASDTGEFAKGNIPIVENEWRSINNNFRVPYNTTQHVRLPILRETYNEDFSDGSFDIPYISFGYHDERYYIENGLYRSDIEDEDGGNLRLHINVTIPEDKLGYFNFRVGMEQTWADDVGASDRIGFEVDHPDIYRVIEWDPGECYRPYQRSSPFYPYNSNNRRLLPGTHTFDIDPYISDGNTEGYMKLDNFYLRLDPLVTDPINEMLYNNAERYVKSKSYDGDSNISLQYNSTSDSEFLIKNFKLYKIKDGNRVPWISYDIVTPEQLQSIFTVNTTNSTVEVVNDEQEVELEEAPMIYKKGELVAYNIYYDDYEGDPSKKQYWQYTHTPWNDGLHPDNNIVLNSPIDRFYHDGKYIVRHWQEDSTGVVLYDKLSNIEEITFYVEGNAIAPEVTYIKTIPAEVKDGNDYKIEIGVDDYDKDILDTTIELYKNNSLIYNYNQNNVAPINEIYPPVLSGFAPTATPGRYTVVATASDATATGMRSYTFTVVSEGNIEGMVRHTEQWDINRKKYNIRKTGTEENPRNYNVFWSGERFILQGDAEGNPISVNVQILGTSYSTNLSSSDGGITWIGDLWDENMINKWGRNAPKTLTFRFTASYTEDMTKEDHVQVIVDDTEPYWQYHQAW